MEVVSCNPLHFAIPKPIQIIGLFFITLSSIYSTSMQLLKMTKEEAENFIYKCLVDNESKKDPKEKLTRLDICDILHTDFEIPKSTAYRYYKDTFNLYKWEQAKPDPSKKIKDTKDTILNSVLDEAESLLAEGKSIEYFKGIELYSKLLTRFKKV